MNYLNGSVLMLVLCMVLWGPVGATERDGVHPDVHPENIESQADFKQAYQTLKDRVEELKMQKKAAVTREEKRAVKEKMKETKQQIKDLRSKPVSGGIYIGSGALLLLLILLIIL